MPVLTEAELFVRGVGPATVVDWLEHGLLARAADGTFEPTLVALELIEALSVRSTAGGYKPPRPAKPRGPRRVEAPRRPHLVEPPQPVSSAGERKRAAAASSSSSPYRSLAMPAAWLPVLTPLPVPLGRLSWTRLPKLEELEQALAQLDGRELEVLRGRERGEVLSEIGASFGLTRERIRQLEADALGALRAGGAVGRAGQQLAPPAGRLVRAVCGNEAEAAGLRLAVFLTGRASGQQLRLATVGPARWLVVDAEQHAAARALAALLMRERFVAAPRLAAALGLSEDELAVLPSLFPGRYLFLPAGLVALGGGSRSPQDFEGVVRLLSAAGFRQWHLSQLAKAVQLLRGDPAAPAVHAVWSHLRRLVETGEVKAVGRSGIWRVGASRSSLASRSPR